jgi:hypothetical protein
MAAPRPVASTPGVEAAMVMEGVVPPVRLFRNSEIRGWSIFSRTPVKVTDHGPPALPLTLHPPDPMVESARSAVCTVAAAASKAMALVIWPLNLSLKEPPVGTPVRVRSWTSEVPLVGAPEVRKGPIPPATDRERSGISAATLMVT